MYPMLFSLLGIVLLALFLAVSEPKAIATRTQVMADAWAANFWAYRDMLVAYQNANPGASATVSNLLLTGYQQPGYSLLSQIVTPTLCLAIPQWSNHIQNGTLYTYSSASAACLPAGTVDAIANRHDRSLMIGIAKDDPVKGKIMTSIFNLSTPVPNSTSPPIISASTIFVALPTVIPQNAIVVIGN